MTAGGGWFVCQVQPGRAWHHIEHSRVGEPIGRRLDIRPQRNGPLVISGNLEICAGTGRTVDRVTGARLCRCGGSQNKPFCDGTHARIHFQS